MMWHTGAIFVLRPITPAAGNLANPRSGNGMQRHKLRASLQNDSCRWWAQGGKKRLGGGGGREHLVRIRRNVTHRCSLEERSNVTEHRAPGLLVLRLPPGLPADLKICCVGLCGGRLHSGPGDVPTWALILFVIKHFYRSSHWHGMCTVHRAGVATCHGWVTSTTDRAIPRCRTTAAQASPRP